MTKHDGKENLASETERGRETHGGTLFRLGVFLLAALMFMTIFLVGGSFSKYTETVPMTKLGLNVAEFSISVVEREFVEGDPDRLSSYSEIDADAQYILYAVTIDNASDIDIIFDFTFTTLHREGFALPIFLRFSFIPQLSLLYPLIIPCDSRACAYLEQVRRLTPPQTSTRPAEPQNQKRKSSKKYGSRKRLRSKIFWEEEAQLEKTALAACGKSAKIEFAPTKAAAAAEPLGDPPLGHGGLF